MRNFPARRSWGSRDRMALLGNTSPPSSPSRFHPSGHNNSDTMFPSLAKSEFNDTPSKAPSQKSFDDDDFQASSGAIQFVPAYQEAVSPSNTQPLTSPEDSFDREDKHRPIIRPPQVTPSPANDRGSADKRRGPRMARLASLFSSRAVIKPSVENSKKPLSASPPHSDASSGYVGWPGTQDKRGGTVTIESSYEDSDPGPSKTPDHSNWNEQPSYQKYSTPQHLDHDDSADLHLTAALVDAAAAARSPIVARKQQRLSHPMRNTVRSLNEIYGKDEGNDKGYDAISPMTDPWAMNTSDDTISDVSTSFSKTSSAYFNAHEVQALTRGKIDHLHAIARNRQAAAAVIRYNPDVPQPPTEEALALKNQITPPHRTFNATNAVGYRGFLDKTKDVPNLMDDTESDTCSSASRATSMHSSVSAAKLRQNRQSRLNKRDDYEDLILEEASSDIFEGIQNGRNTDAESDVFDGLSNAGPPSHTPKGATPRDDYGPYSGDAKSEESPQLVMLGGGLTTIQTSFHDFSNRRTADDFDENLTNSDYDQYGYARIPGFNEMASRGTSSHDRSLSPSSTNLFKDAIARAKATVEKYKQRSSEQSGSESGSSLFSDPYSVDSFAAGQKYPGDLNQYYIQADDMKIVVKFFRKMSRKLLPTLGYEELENEEDATKAFALSEMRSRIMEKDIERGLERRGGTTVVDDLVLTDYNKAALRVRDAVIVSKAWRDGARPMDIINTAFLTRRSLRSYFIPRLANRRFERGSGGSNEITWEEVLWVDDMELNQYRCHSIGPRQLRGFEMFTIGDCQSILLKLCHDRCEELRSKLNETTARQIEAEEIMNEEDGDFGHGVMTEAEMSYFAAMEDVKTCSRQLVIAEKSFNLVRDRIKKLVAKYEHLLVKFDNDAESVAPSSVVTYESSFYSDAYSNVSEEDREREELLRRAERAELRAELAAREARLAKQESRASQSKNQSELQDLQKRLNELQSESSNSFTEREHSVVLARAITAKNRHSPEEKVANEPKKNKIDDVKKRFRERSAAKMRNAAEESPNSQFDSRGYPSQGGRQFKTPAQRDRDNMFRQVGEEMFQQMDFYERSLKAVETPRN